MCNQGGAMGANPITRNSGMMGGGMPLPNRPFGGFQQNYGAKSFQPQQNFGSLGMAGGNMADPSMQMSQPYSVAAPTPTQSPSGWPSGRYGPEQHQPGRTMNPMFSRFDPMGGVSFPGMGDPGPTPDPMQTGGQMVRNAPMIQQGQMSQPYQQQAPAPMNPYAQSQDAYNAAISGNNTANARPLWMQQGPIDQESPQAKGLVMSEGPKATTPPRTNPNTPPLPGPLPPQPTSPMQRGQTGWQWDNQRNQYLPQWNPAARQFLVGATHGSGVPAPWMNSGIQNAEYNNPNFMQMIEQLSGNKFGG